jgi:hypothetical protein
MTRFLGLLCMAAFVIFGPASADAVGTIGRLELAQDSTSPIPLPTTPAPAPATPATPATPAPEPLAVPPAEPAPSTPDSATQPSEEGTQPSDEPSLGEVEEVKVAALTPDSAQRALDAYVLLKEKYKDAQLENYESLQDFVDKDPQGKAFEADVKAAGFANVEEWNVTITTVSNAYSNIVNDQSADINQQIEEVQKDPELAQDMKDRLTHSLKALIPTEENRKVVQALMDNPANAEKTKQLETEEE